MEKPFTLAIIDDELLYHHLIRHSVRKIKPDARILSFYNGYDALVFLKEQAGDAEELPDLVLLDINMAKMDGWQFIDTYETLPPLKISPVVYMCSASILEADALLASRHKLLKGYLAKPVTLEMLQQLINDWEKP